MKLHAKTIREEYLVVFLSAKKILQTVVDPRSHLPLNFGC